jgi:hypothetical protein
MTEVNLEHDGLNWPRRAVALALLAAIGCSDNGANQRAAAPVAPVPRPAPHIPRQAEIAWARPLRPINGDGVEPAGLMSLPDAPAVSPQPRKNVQRAKGPAPGTTELVELPAIEPDGPAAAGPTLLAPRPIDEGFTEWVELATPVEQAPAAPLVDDTLTPTPELPSAPPISSGGLGSMSMPAAVSVPTDHEGRSISPEAEELLADAGATVTGHPTGAVVSEQAQAKIRRGYRLAQRGAYFAARAEFIETLRMISEAKDQKRGAARRSIALANGLRALDEAADFAPHGTAVENRLDIDVIIASHRTPVAKQSAGLLMPQQLSDLYYRYAQLQLGAAVAGEPAGSMALHALGKLYSQIGHAEPHRIAEADRRAFALQQAALLARSDNHLAAHELGVLLAEMGHYVDSEYILAQVAMREPHPVVYRNLARIQRKLGRTELATASDQQAQYLAEQGVSSMTGVKWVDPQTFTRTGDPLAPAMPPTPTGQVAGSPPIPQPRTQNPAVQTQAPVQSEPVHNITRLPGGYFR